MRAYWTDKRPNGEPIEPGTFARVIDLEDGTHPIYVYGKTQEEVQGKIELQNMHAQQALARRSTAASHSGPTQGFQPTPAAVPRRGLSGDQVMQYTADIANPAKAGAAIAALYANEMGIDPEEEAKQRFANLFAEWEREHTEYMPHPGNRHIVAAKAIGRAGLKPALVTKEILTQCFTEALADGLLFEEQPAGNDGQPNPANPGESQALRAERPRGALRATSMRSSSFRAPQSASQNRTLKYTREAFRKLTSAQRESLIRTNDADYFAAAEAYYPQAASA
jgi:hypothetical protein